MNILFITEFFPTGKDLKFSGGVEARTYFVARDLAKKHNVTVICTKQKNTKLNEVINGIIIKRVGPELPYNAGSGKGINPITLIKFISAAIMEGTKNKYDIVDGSNFIAHFIAKQISITKKIPVVFWYPDVFLGQWIKSSGLSGLLGFILEKTNITRNADYFIAISKETSKKLIKNSIDKSKIAVIPCGVNANEFKSKKQIKDNFKIICVSRLVKYKRIKDLIIASASILKENSKASLLILGRGPEENNLKNLTINLNIHNQVFFKSNLTRVNFLKELKSAKVFCLPSEIEGFGISTIEAAAAGIPYVVSDINVFKEVTKNGYGGYLFELGNVSDLSSKIKKLLSDKKLYDIKSKEAQNLSKFYDWKQISKETEKVYKTLI